MNPIRPPLNPHTIRGLYTTDLNEFFEKIILTHRNHEHPGKVLALSEPNHKPNRASSKEKSPNRRSARLLSLSAAGSYQRGRDSLLKVETNEPVKKPEKSADVDHRGTYRGN